MTKSVNSEASIRDVIALFALERETSISGRTLLQKQIYFYSVLAKKDFGYGAHYYGPYSPTVAASVDSLISSGWIDDNKVPYGIADSFGPVVRHDISASEELRKYEKNFRGSKFETARELVTRVTSHVASENARQLSLAAKLHFISADTGIRSLKELERLTEKYNWDMSEFSVSDREQVIEYFKHIGLLRKRS